MSGRQKRIVYTVLSCVTVVAAYAGAILIAGFFARTELDWGLFSLALALGLLAVPALFHETGHLLTGLCVGFRPATFSFGWFTVGRGGVKFGKSAVAGETQLYATNGKGIRGKLIFSTLGGALMNFLLGGTMLALFFALPHAPVRLLLGGFAPFMLAEGLCALYPAELEAGKTDGAMLLGLIKKAPEEDMMLRVFTAQGILYRGEFGDIPEELFSNAPVVREDLPAFRAFLLLKAQRLLAFGREDEAKETLSRLCSLSEFFQDGEAETAERYCGYFEGNFVPGKAQLLRGVARLEEGLAARCEKKNILP